MIQLTITYDPTNRQIGVTGPIEDKTACYGILEAAKDAIREHHAKKQGLVVASPAMAAAIERNTSNT